MNRYRNLSRKGKIAVWVVGMLVTLSVIGALTSEAEKGGVEAAPVTTAEQTTTTEKVTTTTTIKPGSSISMEGARAIMACVEAQEDAADLAYLGLLENDVEEYGRSEKCDLAKRFIEEAHGDYPPGPTPLRAIALELSEHNMSIAGWRIPLTMGNVSGMFFNEPDPITGVTPDEARGFPGEGLWVDSIESLLEDVKTVD